MVRPMTEGSATATPPPTLFTKVKRTRSSDDVVDQVRDAIIYGKLKSGDRLPGERDLCVVFGVSRATLREGLRTLEALGASRSGPDPRAGSSPPSRRPTRLARRLKLSSASGK